MREPKTISDYPKWLTREERAGRFASSLPPQEPETRRPWLWIAEEDDEIYLVNATGEPLDLVKADTGGFQTIDDDVAPVSSKTKYEYYDVQPNQAVKVEQYDYIFDSDFVLQTYIEVKSAKLGHLLIATPAEKGGIGETVLLWDSGEPGRHVHIGHH